MNSGISKNTSRKKRRLMIIGAGGVGSVICKKSARMDDIYEEIILASRTVSKCDTIAAESGPVKVSTAQVDADHADEVVSLIRKTEPDILINAALPYQDLSIMDACLETRVHYIDTANYEPKDQAKFEYSWQWAYRDAFTDRGIMALLGCGFDPGVTGIFTAYAAKHYFDEIQSLDIVDCNAGDHGKSFATNFNPEINIREITQAGRYWQDGRWIETEPLEIHQPVDYPKIGPRESYLLYHEELESLTKNFPSLKRARFWMTFSQEYITHLQVLQNVGMTSIQPVEFQGMQIQPLQFLKAVLPEPSSLGHDYQGETSIGCQIQGVKDGAPRNCYLFNNCRHQDAYADAGAQAVSYTTGVPAALAGRLLAEEIWMKPGVFNVEEMDPDPFMKAIPDLGLPWEILLDTSLAFDDTEGDNGKNSQETETETQKC
ncbi:MAG: saccharopine dehydrogenase family protein [Spirochaetia bacterium]|nr:saccharopine dehydrogenase family protein [Spirochaetia bacterium]